MSRVEQDLPPRGSARKPAAAAPLPEEDGLLAALKATRLRLAQEEGVPLYVIFSNATLADMVRLRPRSREEFLLVSGVGEVKARKYADAFLETLAQAEESEG